MLRCDSVGEDTHYLRAYFTVINMQCDTVMSLHMYSVTQLILACISLQSVCY